MAQDWQMPRAQGRCAAGDREFQPGDVFRTYLFETTEGYERRDYCLTCTPPDVDQAVGSWKTRMPEPTLKKAAGPNRASLRAIYDSLAAEERDDRRQLRFFLALLLWRQKGLKLEGTRREGEAEIWSFRCAASGELHELTRPEIDEERVELLSRQLEELFNTPLAAEGSEQASGAEAASE